VRSFWRGKSSGIPEVKVGALRQENRRISFSSDPVCFMLLLCLFLCEAGRRPRATNTSSRRRTDQNLSRHVQTAFYSGNSWTTRKGRRSENAARLFLKNKETRWG